MAKITLTVNRTQQVMEVEPSLLLAELLRENLRLTGTHVGCDTSQCGACTVLIDGSAVKSCTVLAVQADGAEITTVEGLAQNGELHPIQRAFSAEHALQCGFCTPGLMITAIDLLERNPAPTDADIRHAIKGNLCRCTGYHNIVSAIRSAATEMRGATAPMKAPAEVKR
ncbi:MAG TPA: (2Fe-2S)-binding protein [Candidatus Limnocylindria bacterium]